MKVANFHKPKIYESLNSENKIHLRFHNFDGNYSFPKIPDVHLVLGTFSLVLMLRLR